MDKHSSGVSYITALITSTFGALTLQELALWVGIATALGTFLINWYYKYRETKWREGHAAKD